MFESVSLHSHLLACLVRLLEGSGQQRRLKSQLEQVVVVVLVHFERESLMRRKRCVDHRGIRVVQKVEES